MRLSRIKRPKALWWYLANPDGVPPPRPKWIRRRSVRMERKIAEYRRERLLFLADHPICEFPGCRRKSTQIHHRRGRVGCLLLLKQFWTAICWAHHRWIGENPRASRDLFMLAQPGEWNSPPKS